MFVTSATPASHAPETIDRVDVPRPLFAVAYAESLLRREGEYADLALMQIPMHLVRRLSGLLQRERLGQRRVDQAAVDQAVGLPGFTVVGEVAPHDALEVHP